MKTYKEIEEENRKLKQEIEEKKKWKKIIIWTNIIGSMILLLILSYGIIIKLLN